MDPSKDAAPELPPDMWNEIFAFLQTEDTLLTLTQVSKGTQDAAEKELTRRWVDKGFLLATGPKELTAALADPHAQVIVTRGGTVASMPANPNAHVIAAGPVAVTDGEVYVRNSIGSITSVTDGVVFAYDSAQVTNVSGGRVFAHDSVQVTNVTGGNVSARDNARVTATGGKISAHDNASVHSEGATIFVFSSDAAITATSGAIHLHVPNPQIIYSGDVTFYNDAFQQIAPPGADDA